MEMRFRRIPSGHSLLEAVLAAVIFAIISVFLMGVWDMQFKAMSKSKEMVVASYLAERVMEDCIAAGYKVMAGEDDFEPLYQVPVELKVRSRTRAGVREATYLATATTEQHVNFPADPQLFVTVKVEYTDSTGPNSVTYTTSLHRDQ